MEKTPSKIYHRGRLITLSILLVLTIILFWPIMPFLILIPLFIAFSGDAGPSGALLALGIILAIGGVLFAIFYYLVSRKKYIIGLLLLDLIFISINLFFPESKVRLEQTAYQMGFHLTDNTPDGILNIDPESIPSGYIAASRGEISAYSYYKRYNSDSFLSLIPERGMRGSINLDYSLHPRLCSEFHSPGYERATCKLGDCVVSTSIDRPATTHLVQHFDGSVTEKTDKPKFSSRTTRFSLNDNGYCVDVAFEERDEKRLLSEEEMMRVVDSLKRTSGDRSVSPDEYATSSLKFLSHFLEEHKKKHEKTHGTSRVYPGIKIGDCQSDISVDVSPSDDTYVIHQPICPTKEMSYCLEKDQPDIVQVPTAVVEQTYHCR